MTDDYRLAHLGLADRRRWLALSSRTSPSTGTMRIPRLRLGMTTPSTGTMRIPHFVRNDYSARSAMTGSMRVDALAGMMVAIAATASSTQPTAMSVTLSVGLTS